MAKFNQNVLQAASRGMSALHGIEKTPEQCGEMFNQMIEAFRAYHLEAGTAGAEYWTDAEVWELIRAYMRGRFNG